MNGGGGVGRGKGRQWAARTGHTRLGTHLSLLDPSPSSVLFRKESPAGKILWQGLGDLENLGAGVGVWSHPLGSPSSSV